jgi:hypothetical protein
MTIDEEKNLLKEVCLNAHSWNEIMSILKNKGSKMSLDTAQRIACREHYPRKYISRGGKRDHSHEEPALIKMHTSDKSSKKIPKNIFGR